MEKLADPRFLVFYTDPPSPESIDFAKNAVLGDLYSQELRTPIWDYVKAVFAIRDGSQEQKDHLWKRHQELYHLATRLLGARGAELPDFTILKSKQAESLHQEVFKVS